MIKEEKVKVSINQRNFSYYKKLGYDFDYTHGEKNLQFVNVLDIPKRSKVVITAICELCESERNLSISKYWQNHERQGFYSCFKCKNVKLEKTVLKKYGKKHFSQTQEFIEKYKSTCIERYGVDSPTKLKSVKDKMEETCMERYGVRSPLLQAYVIEKNRDWMSSNEFKNKSIDTLKKRYGVDSFSKTQQFKDIIQDKKIEIVEKIKKTFLENYGCEWYSSTNEFKEKYLNKLEEINQKKIETCLNRYGVDNVSKVDEFIDKVKRTKIDKGIILPDAQISDWQKYKRMVTKITKKNKKRLFEKWDGLDFYDDELIIGYMSYSHIHRFYPTIDHKISVFYGFKNEIGPELIGSIDNLCITKRYINSIKRATIDSEFSLN